MAQLLSSGEEEYEIVKYGLHQCFLITVNLVSIIICGAFWHEIPFALLLFLSLFLLRPYAGGYHADTQLRCYMISVGVMNLVIAGRKFMNMSIVVWMYMYIGAFLIIWRNAPVENSQHLLENKEIQIYSYKAKQIVAGYTLLEGMSILLHTAAYGCNQT